MELLKRFIYPLSDAKVASEVQEITRKTGLSTLEAAILYNRNISDVDEIQRTLNGNLGNLHDPSLMKDAVLAAQTIVNAIQNDEKIVLYSDYDADGWGSAVTGFLMFKEMGVDLPIYTNQRKMGYGICKQGIDEIVSLYPDVKIILTADNGIVAFEAVDYANSLGLKVVITDHHQPTSDGKLPNAVAIVNPHRLDCEYPYKYLCGAGVLWKMLSLCFVLSGIPFKNSFRYLDIVATSTIADVVELKDENRIIVKQGLKMISEECRIHWKVFKKVFSSFYAIENVDSRTIGFTFGPAINAVSRMQGSIEKAIKVFFTEDEESIVKRVEELKIVNNERKILTEDSHRDAMEICIEYADDPIIIVRHSSFGEGIVGLVAGRIKELLNKPSLVFTKTHDGKWKGSGRSIPGYNIKVSLDEVQNETKTIIGYGGHSQACGLTVSDEQFEDFKKAMIEHARKNIPEECFVKNVIIDYEASEDEIDDFFVDKIKNLEPYGNGLEEPMIALSNFKPTEISYLGDSKQHLVLKGKNFEVISWYGAEVLENHKDETFNVCGKIERDRFSIKLIVEPSNIL